MTLGGPQPIKNGGLLHSRLRYFDVARRRPGLPQDVGALVEKLQANRTVVRFVNLSPVEARQLIVQGGAYGEHTFTRATWNGRTGTWPGELGGYAGTYAAPALTTEVRSADIGASRESNTIRGRKTPCTGCTPQSPHSFLSSRILLPRASHHQQSETAWIRLGPKLNNTKIGARQTILRRSSKMIGPLRC